MVFPAELAVRKLIEQNDRVELLRIANEHQLFAPQHRDQRNRHIALACLVNNRHVKQRLRLPELVRGNTGSNHDRKNLLQLFYILGFLQIFVKRFRLCIRILAAVQYLPQILEPAALEPLDIFRRGVIQILVELILVPVEKAHRVPVGDLADLRDALLNPLHLVALQVRLKRHEEHRVFHRLLILYDVRERLLPLL